MAVFLVGVAGPAEGQRWRLQPGALTIGAGEGCDVRLAGDRDVQPVHAALQVSAREITIAGRPGAEVLVDGLPAVAPLALTPGATVTIGRSSLRLEALALEPAAARPVAAVPPSADLGLALPPPDPPRWPLILSIFGAVLAVVAAALIWRLVPERVRDIEEQFADDVVARVKQATVWVRVSDGEGSGFVLRDGVVITNAHVVAGASRAEVYFGSGTPTMRRVDAKVIKAGRPGHPTDVAVLTCPTGDTPSLPLADLASLSEGTAVAAFGYPLGGSIATGTRGPDISVRGGTVTALRKNDRGQPEWIEADIAAEVGNSGGPVVTTRGDVVGLATMIVGSHLKATLAVPATRIAEFAGSTGQP